MKVNVTSKNATSGLVQGASIAGGAIVSKGAMSIAPAALKTPYVRAGVAAVALIVSASLTGKGTVTEVLKNVALGVGVQQSMESIATFVAPSLPVSENTAGRFLEGSFKGLGAADTTATFNIPANVWQRNEQPAEEAAGFVAY